MSFIGFNIVAFGQEITLFSFVPHSHFFFLNVQHFCNVPKVNTSHGKIDIFIVNHYDISYLFGLGGCFSIWWRRVFPALVEEGVARYS